MEKVVERVRGCIQGIPAFHDKSLGQHKSVVSAVWLRFLHMATARRTAGDVRDERVHRRHPEFLPGNVRVCQLHNAELPYLVLAAPAPEPSPPLRSMAGG